MRNRKMTNENSPAHQAYIGNHQLVKIVGLQMDLSEREKCSSADANLIRLSQSPSQGAL